MNSIVSSIREFSSDELVTELEGIAYDNSVCIQYSLNSGDRILYNTLMVGCGLNKNNSQITSLMNEAMESEKDTSNIKLINIDTGKQSNIPHKTTIIGLLLIYK